MPATALVQAEPRRARTARFSRVSAGEPTLGGTVAALRAAREHWRTRRDEARDIDSFPSRDAVARIVDDLAAALYPRWLGRLRGDLSAEDGLVAAKLIAAYADLEREVGAELGYRQQESRAAFDPDQPATIVRLFGATLAEARRLVDSDVEAAFLGDPAARTVDEVLVCHPDVIATFHRRVAHQLHNLGAPIVACMIAEIANERTGIDIHPGATIGTHFFIDHGTGAVIGETAIIGDRVRLHQHVTLGARGALGDAPRDARRRLARHPIVEDDVVIYAGATILGRVTLGARSTIGGDVWLLSDVPPDSPVVQPEARRLDPAASSTLHDALVEVA